MPLTNEKNNLFIISQNKSVNFPKIDNMMESYYIPYGNSKHTLADIEIYCSDIVYIRKKISDMWKDTSNIDYLSDICSAIYKEREIEENLLDTIDLYNYMM